MPVNFNEKTNIFQLDTADSSYIMQIRSGYLTHLYWGKNIDLRDHSYMSWFQQRAAFSSMDENGKFPILDDTRLEYPSWGRGDNRSPALEIINPDGTNIVDLKYKSYKISETKPSLSGLPSVYLNKSDKASTLEIVLADSVSDVEVSLFYTIIKGFDVILRHSLIKNKSKKIVKINAAASACVDFDDKSFDVISNYGTHCRERMIERFPLSYGKFELASRRGSSSHVHNPFLILPRHDATETAGDVYGAVLVYSGSFSASIEATQFSASRLLIGLNPADFSWVLKPGEEFCTPEAVLCFSSSGIEKLSHNYSRLFRKNLCRGKFRDMRRPVLLNMWEGCYFDFDEARINAIADCSAELGIELLVIDDGWFGQRNSDNCSLGDWYVNKNKLPNGIAGVYDNIKKNSLNLGIWFEPEMVSPDSDLFRAHPDWCIHCAGRPNSQGRHQLILDLSRLEVCDYLYNSIADILKTDMIAYVKWDFNRNMTELGNEILSAEAMGELSHRYYLGLYSLLERLVTDFPEVLFESCSGGGGRFDAGMLYYMPQVWTSDNSDAIDRLKIQYGTSLVYPMSAMSAHISASPNHQTGHVTDFDTRKTVAFTGSFGYELDPTRLSEADKEKVRESAALYKKYGEVLSSGDYYRLISPYNNDCCAWSTVSADKSVCVAGYVLTRVRLYEKNERIVLRGLDKNAVYLEIFSNREFSGKQLMGFGIDVHLTLEYKSQMWIFKKIS